VGRHTEGTHPSPYPAATFGNTWSPSSRWAGRAPAWLSPCLQSRWSLCRRKTVRVLGWQGVLLWLYTRSVSSHPVSYWRALSISFGLILSTLQMKKKTFQFTKEEGYMWQPASQPAASSQQPAASSQQPAASSQQPAASSHQTTCNSGYPETLIGGLYCAVDGYFFKVPKVPW